MELVRHSIRPWLLDGGMGTELIARGLRVRQDCAESWNVDRPDEVRAIHASYQIAGADVVHTNTFGGTKTRLARFGAETRQAELLRAAVELARDGAEKCQVWGSLGPSGETIPLGAGDLSWLESVFAEAAQHLVDGGVDAVHVETMFHAGELEAAVRGVRRATAGRIPIVASITLMPGASGLETPHGVPMARMLRALDAVRPDAVGVNCSIEAERMLRAVDALYEATQVWAPPVVAQPQAKMSDKCATGRSSESPESFARQVARLLDAGCAAVGGCCGVGPSGIAALRALIDARVAGTAASTAGFREART